MQTLFYKTNRLIEPKDVHVRVDENFYTHHCHPLEDWQKLLETARSAEKIEIKKVLGQELTEVERHAENLYYGPKKPDLEIDPDGVIRVNEGRHRMQALKEAGVSLTMEVMGYIDLVPVRGLEDLYQQKGWLFKKISDKLKPEHSYIIAETTLNNLPRISREAYSAIEMQDYRTEKHCVVISSRSINEPKALKADIEEWMKRSIPVFSARGQNYKEGLERTAETVSKSV